MTRWQEIWHGLQDEFSDLPDLDSFTRLMLRLVLASFVGGVIGWERQRAGKDAGVRTHMLVALAAAVFVLVPEQEGAAPADLSRVIQGVAAGVGFLGVGMIFKREHSETVSGLTSASGIWLTAGLGVAAGLGRAATALTTTMIALVILTFLRRLEGRLRPSPSGETSTDAPPGRKA